MVGEKRKHDDISHVDMMVGERCECPYRALSASDAICCECHEGDSSREQKRPCIHHDPSTENVQNGVVSSQNVNHTIYHHPALRDNQYNSQMDATENMDIQENNHRAMVDSCLPSTTNIVPTTPKRCLRCASGESGHIKHILS